MRQNISACADGVPRGVLHVDTHSSKASCWHKRKFDKYYLFVAIHLKAEMADEKIREFPIASSKTNDSAIITHVGTNVITNNTHVPWPWRSQENHRETEIKLFFFYDFCCFKSNTYQFFAILAILPPKKSW